MPDRSLSSSTLRTRSGLADVRVYARLRSTNTRAAQLIERGELRLPAAVVAARQTAGRGRGGNAWWSDAGTLTATFVFPADPWHSLPEIPLRAGLAVRSVAARYADPECLRVKWPNDVLAGGRKLAGILCERVRDAHLIGVGFNVATDFAAAPPEVRRRAASLADRMHAAPPSRGDVLVQLASALGEVLDAPEWWHELSRVHALTGREVEVDTCGELVRGRCTGIDPGGALLVRDRRGEHRILSGQVLAPTLPLD